MDRKIVLLLMLFVLFIIGFQPKQQEEQKKTIDFTIPEGAVEITQTDIISLKDNITSIDVSVYGPSTVDTSISSAIL